MKLLLLLAGLWSAAAGAVEWRTVTGAGGLPLQVAEAGPADAPGILFIHGATLSSSSWLQQLESSLANQWHLVAFDLRGHGSSGKSWNPADFADSRAWADDVAAVLAATGLERPVVVAWSYGGHVAMDFVRHYPAGRLAGLVLVGSAGGMLPPPVPDAAMAAEFATLGRLARSPVSADRLQAARRFVAGMAATPLSDAILDREVASVLAVTPELRAAMVGRPLDNADLVGRLTLPVLFIVGDADRTAPADSVAGLAGRIPGARVSRYPGTGHMPFIERRERFDRELGEFARSVHLPPGGRAQAPTGTGP
jgi:pimeloyl-ACP methyl ester carboxylesterase